MSGGELGEFTYLPGSTLLSLFKLGSCVFAQL